MRILLSCLQGAATHPLPAYDFWRMYFVEGCREAEIEYAEVPGVDWVEGLAMPAGEARQAWLGRTWEAVLDFVRREQRVRPIDVFLGYLYPAQVDPQAIAALQALGIPCVNFFCDNVREFGEVPDVYRPFALHWVPEFEALAMYRRAGMPCLHAPMPCWVPPDMRGVPGDEPEPPTFIGSADILRRHLLGAAIRAGADLYVRGPGWATGAPDGQSAPAARKSLGTVLSNQWTIMRAQGVGPVLRKVVEHWRPLEVVPVPAERILPAVASANYLEATRRAKVTVGVNRVPTPRASNRQPLTYSRLRDIEAPMVGACYLTEWTRGLEDLYDIGTEIETYRTPEELAGKIAALIGDGARRRRLRERGQRRALDEHSAARSLRRIAREVAGGPPA